MKSSLDCGDFICIRSYIEASVPAVSATLDATASAILCDFDACL